ncbi:MAG: hypothetical protein LBI69_00040 [Puniceicoccales bacterium]|nr:hypothetical protein [Puniceicoccales bacterium]
MNVNYENSFKACAYPKSAQSDGYVERITRQLLVTEFISKNNWEGYNELDGIVIGKSIGIRERKWFLY